MEIFNTLLSKESELAEKLFFSGRLVVELIDIYKLLVDAFFELNVETEEDKISFNATYLSLVQVISLFSKISEESKRKEILIQNGGYLNILSKLFSQNHLAMRPKLWNYSWAAINHLCEQPFELKIEDFSDILISIGEQLLDQNFKISSVYSLYALQDIIEVTRDHEGIWSRIQFVKKKLNIVVEIIIDILQV